MNRYTLSLIVLFLFAVLFVACGGDDESASSADGVAATVTPLLIVAATDVPPTAVPTIAPTAIPNLPQLAEVAHVLYRGMVLTTAGDEGWRIQRPVSNEAGALELVQAFTEDVWDIALQGDIAYMVGCQRECVRKIDLSNLDAPQQIGNAITIQEGARITRLAAGGEWLYVVVDGVTIALVDASLRVQNWVELPGTVTDLTEALMGSVVSNSDAMYLNVVVDQREIYGVEVATGDIVGVQPAPKGVWHSDVAGEILGVSAAWRSMIVVTADRGVRSYKNWSAFNGLEPRLEGGAFAYGAGRLVDAVMGENHLLYVLSETAEAQWVTVYKTDMYGVEGRSARWLQAQEWEQIDEVRLPQGERISKIDWHRRQLWGVMPEVRPISGLITPVELALLSRSAGGGRWAYYTEPPQSVTRVVERIGGNPRVFGRSGNAMYIGMSNELWVYDVSDPNAPQLVKKLAFPEYLRSLILVENAAILLTRGFENTRSVYLDLVDPFAPSIVKQVNHRPVWSVSLKNGVAFAEVGIIEQRIFQLFDPSTAAFDPLAADHPLSQIYGLGAQQIAQDTDGRYLVPDDQQDLIFTQYFLRGDVLVVSWRDSMSCAEVSTCLTGIIGFDLSNFLLPKIIYSQLYEGQPGFGLESFSAEGVLKISPSSVIESVDLRPYLPENFDYQTGYDILPDESRQDSWTMLDPLSGLRSRDIVMVGEVAHIFTMDGGWHLAEAARLPEVSIVERLELPSAAIEAIAVNDVMMVRLFDQARLYDVADSRQPALMRTFPISNTWDTAVLTDKVLARGTDNVLMIDPLYRDEYGTIEFSGMIRELLGQKGDYFYLVLETIDEGLVLVTLDLSDPIQPEIVGSAVEFQPAEPSSYYVDSRAGLMRDGYLFFTCGWRQTCLFDIESDPAQPQLYKVSDRCDLTPLAVDRPDLPYVVGLDRPVNPADILAYLPISRELCAEDMSRGPHTAISGDLLLSTNDLGGIVVEALLPDVRRDTVVPLNDLGYVAGDIGAMVDQGRWVYVAVGEELLIYDAGQTPPVRTARFPFGSLIEDLVVVDSRALVVTEGGDYVLDLEDPAQPLVMERLKSDLVEAKQHGDLIITYQRGDSIGGTRFWELGGDGLRPLSDDHRLHLAVAQMLAPDSGIGAAVSLQEVNTWINQTVLYGELLILSYQLEVFYVAVIDLSAEQPELVYRLQTEGPGFRHLSLGEAPHLVLADLFDHTIAIDLAAELPAERLPTVGDLSESSAMTAVREHLKLAPIMEIEVADGVIYAQTGGQAMRLFDGSGLAGGRPLAEFSLVSPMHDFVVRDGLLFGSDWQRLSVYDLADPLAPTLIDEVLHERDGAEFEDKSSQSLEVEVTDALIVHTVDRLLAVHDRDRRLLGSGDGGLLGQLWFERPVQGLAVYGDYAYVMTQGEDIFRPRLSVVDLRDPAALRVVRVLENTSDYRFPVLGQGNLFDVRSGVLYVACDFGLVCRFDVVSDPTRPIYLGSEIQSICPTRNDGAVWVDAALLEANRSATVVVWGVGDAVLGRVDPWEAVFSMTPPDETVCFNGGYVLQSGDGGRLWRLFELAE